MIVQRIDGSRRQRVVMFPLGLLEEEADGDGNHRKDAGGEEHGDRRSHRRQNHGRAGRGRPVRCLTGKVGEA